MDQQFLKNNQAGYIALISAIIISIILVGMTFTVSRAGYFSRFGSLDAENKRISKGLAESCVNEALLRIAQNAGYTVSGSGESFTVDGSVTPPLVCKIDSIANPSTYLNNQKNVTITASAFYPAENGTFSQIETSSTIQDPGHRAPAKIVVNAYSYGTGAKTPDQFGPFGVGGTPVSLGVSQVFSAGNYAVTQGNAEPTKYKTAYAGDCDSTGHLTLGVNDYKTCNILNTIRPQTAKLTIIIASSDGTLPSHLTFNGTALAPQLTQAVTIQSELNADGTDKTFTISIGIDAAHYTTSDWSGTDCSGVFSNGQVTLKKGDNKVCAISYNKKAQDPKAALTVVTRVMNVNGGSAQPADFNMHVAAAGMALQSQTSDTESKTVTYYIDPGTFNVTEDDKANYQKIYKNSGYPYQCECDSGNGCTVTEGKSYLCLITNTDIPTTFTLTAAVNVDRPYGVAPVPSFTIKLTGFGVNKTLSSGVAENNLAPGNYSLTLSGIPSGYLINQWGPYPDCSPIGTLSWASGDQRYKTCTIDVVEIPPPFNAVDTLMVLDRTGSMFNSPSNTYIGGERTAAKAFLNSYSALAAPRPQVGVAVFANDSNVSAKIAGNLTSSYGSEAVGPASSVNLAPSGNGHYNSWTAYPSLSSKTSDVVGDDGDTTYINTSTNGAAQTFVITNANLPAGSVVNSVSFYAVARAGSSTTPPANIKLRLENNTTSGYQWDDGGHDLTAGYVTYQYNNGPMTINPATGAAWTLNDVNNWGTLRFGVVRNNSSASSPRVTQIYIVVNYSGLNATGLYLAINNGLANSHGGTDISAAINTANTELNNTATHIAGHRKYIIMLSDGQANQHSIAGDSTDPTLAALQEADKAKTNGGADGIDTEIYTIHFGGIANVTVNSATETSQAFLAQLASGSTPLAGHQNGSHSDITVAATDSNYLSQVNAENNDGDNFFIVPVSADPTAAMTAIFNKIGQQIISGTPPAYITTGTLNVITHVVNNNGHTKTAGNFLMTVSGANPTRQFAGKETPGTELTLNPGDYAVLENPDSDYTETVESQCGGTLG